MFLWLISHMGINNRFYASATWRCSSNEEMNNFKQQTLIICFCSSCWWFHQQLITVNIITMRPDVVKLDQNHFSNTNGIKIIEPHFFFCGVEILWSVCLNIENIKTILRDNRGSGKSKDMNAGLKKTANGTVWKGHRCQIRWAEIETVCLPQ